MKVNTSEEQFLNLRPILRAKNISNTEAAALIFPNLKHPVKALSRILSGKGELSSSQVLTLAKHLGCTPNDLYEPQRWLWSDDKDGELVFIYGRNFRAEVNKETWETAIFYDSKEIDRRVFCDGSSTLKEFFDQVEARIKTWIELS